MTKRQLNLGRRDFVEAQGGDCEGGNRLLISLFQEDSTSSADISPLKRGSSKNTDS